jgi:hypothetical protein
VIDRALPAILAILQPPGIEPIPGVDTVSPISPMDAVFCGKPIANLLT